ncbi:hypothetical protein A4X13_0g2035 [Tilletia indica]|uniref:AAA+ ATPase domain-containing protein n=1 Tax=Tilletia indica TaxID=43049 RepID=A0A177TD21_9BASI|nr:hypothetical protein A4X13_0g2035 [Tilletia indica]
MASSGAGGSSSSTPSTNAASTSNSTQTTPNAAAHAEIEQLVGRARKAQRSNEPFSRLLVLVPNLVKNDPEALKHIYCSKATWAPPGRQLQAAMVRCYAFTEKPELTKWLQTQANSYFGCEDCLDCYMSARQIANEQFLNELPPDRVLQFQDHIDSWNHAWIQKLLTSRGITSGKDLHQLSSAEMYAFLNFAVVRYIAHVPTSGGANPSQSQQDPRSATQKPLYAILQSVSEKNLLHNAKRFSPAHLLLLAGSDSVLREWADLHVDSSVPSFVGSDTLANPIFTSAIRALQAKLASDTLLASERTLIWKAVSNALESEEVAPLATQLSGLVMEHLQDDGTHLPLILKSFRLVLHHAGSKLFGAQEDLAVFATTMLGRITDSSALFRSAASESATEEINRGDLFGWMDEFLAAILDNYQRPDGEVTFRDCLKNIAHWCFERCKGSDVLPPATALIMDEGLKSLLALVHGTYEYYPRNLTISVRKLDSELVSGRQNPPDGKEDAIDEVLDMHMVRFRKVIRDVLAFHAKSLVGAACDDPKSKGKSSETATVSEVKITAQQLLTSVFEVDASSVAETMHRLSEHNTFYKNQLAKTKPADMEAVFKRAEKTLPEPLAVCHELWRAGYDAMEGSESMAVIMMDASVPLSVFAPVVFEDLLKTHSLPAPVIDKSDVNRSSSANAAFQRYLRQLRSVIVSYDQRVRETRGELATMMERIGFTGDEELLRRICSEHADVVIALALSAQPSLRNTALTFARQAFEEYGSREECLRALLKANPGAAITGLNQYLETFQRAAAKLVEASKAAAWMVRSFADIMTILCGPDGVLRSGSSFSVKDQPELEAQLSEPLAELWKLMCRSVEAIYDRTPHWSKVLARTELLAWFRDVNLFATEMLDNLEVVQAAVNGETEETEEPAVDLVAEFARPVVAAFQWMRLNELDTLLSSFQFVQRGLERIMEPGAIRSGKDAIASTLKTKLDGLQGKAKDGKVRCLLSKEQLGFLRLLIFGEEEAARQEQDLLDSDDEVEFVDMKGKGGEFSMIGDRVRRPYASGSTAPSVPERQSRPYNMNPDAKHAKTTMRQSSIFDAMARASAKESSGPRKPQAGVSSSSASSSRNAYQSAGASATKRADRHSGSTKQSSISKMKAAHKAGMSRTTAARQGVPVAPAARSSVTGALNRDGPRASTPTRSTAKPPAADEEDSSPEKPKHSGLHALHETAEEVRRRQQFAVENMKRKRAQDKGARIRVDPNRAAEAARRDEDARKLKLQAEPNFTQLHEVILSWSSAVSADMPPNFDASTLRQMPQKFGSAKEYLDAFEPFFILDTWADFCRAKEELHLNGNPRLPVTVGSRSAINRFTEIVVHLHAPDPKLVRFTDTDVMFLCAETGPAAVLAKVQNVRREGLNYSMTLRLNLRQDPQKIGAELLNGSRWHLQRVFSLSTTHRAYAALLKVQHFKLRDAVLSAEPEKGGGLSKWDVEKLTRRIDVNVPQAQAIIHALNSTGFSLIQGPPGTGKTKTICGLIQQSFNGGSTKAKRPKIFICAPSNAAIDEVARRAKMLELPNGGKLAIVRVGRTEKISSAVADITLDVMVDMRMAATDDRITTKDASQLHATVQQLKNEINELRDKIKLLDGYEASKEEVQNLVRKRKEKEAMRQTTLQQLDEVKDKQKDTKRQQDADRIKFRRQILDGADVICSTLSGAGQDSFGNMEFETVIIDEAAQAVELETLIPLRFDCQRCILVGDQNQLPPTVLSGVAKKYGYAKSLFVRMFENAPERVHLLSIQYRMHPQISSLPSATFYQSRLTDGPNMAAKTAQPWHDDPLLGPFKFFSCSGREVTGRAHSLRNREEVDIALAIYGRLRRLWGADLDYRVGVISPYKDQVNALRSGFEYRYDRDISNRVDFNTVDGFQGQEKDIIIFSCVRSGDLGASGQVGFLRDPRRANVALTRAKSNLFIIGNAPYLRNDPVWGFIIWHAEARELLHHVEVKNFETPVGATRLPPPPMMGQGRPAQKGALDNALWSAGMLARHPHGSVHRQRSFAAPYKSNYRAATVEDEKEVEEGEVVEDEIVDPYWAAGDAAAAAALKRDTGAADERQSTDGDSLWGDDSDKDEPMTEPQQAVDPKASASSNGATGRGDPGAQGSKGPSATKQSRPPPPSKSAPASTSTAGTKRPAPVVPFDPFGTASSRPQKVAKKGPGGSSVANGTPQHPLPAKPTGSNNQRGGGRPPAALKVHVVPKGGSLPTRPGGASGAAGKIPPLGPDGKVMPGSRVSPPIKAGQERPGAAGAPTPGVDVNAAVPSANALSALFVKKRK